MRRSVASSDLPATEIEQLSHFGIRVERARLSEFRQVPSPDSDGTAEVLFEVFSMTLLEWMRPNPFDFRTVILAKHAQHVVLIHFPIALFIVAVVFDLIAFWTKRRTFADAAYYNLLVAALATIPTLVTGIIAWQLQLEGQRLKGILLQHLLLGTLSGALIWLVWWLHFRARKQMNEPPNSRFWIETFAVLVVIATAHLGGFLSGVNVPS